MICYGKRKMKDYFFATYHAKFHLLAAGDFPKTRRPWNLFIEVTGARENNLKQVDVKVVAYYSADTDLRAASEHPDWEQVDAASTEVLVN